MIARIWRGSSSTDKANDYHHHFSTKVAPQLSGIEGHLGAYLLRRDLEGKVEFLAITLWDSIGTIKKFAGPNPDAAVVEPEARAALTEFDDFARHYEIVYSDRELSER